MSPLALGGIGGRGWGPQGVAQIQVLPWEGGSFRDEPQATRGWGEGARVCQPGTLPRRWRAKHGSEPAAPKETGRKRGWVREVGAGPLKQGTYRKDFMSKPRFRICPTTWSQLPGLDRLRPPAGRYLEPAEEPCRAWPRPWARGLGPGTEAAWACSWPRLWLVVGWLGCRPRWCWLSGCCRLCCRVRVRGRWHFGSPVELGIDSRVVAVDRVESSKLGAGGGEERKEKQVKGSQWRRKTPRARTRRPQCQARSAGIPRRASIRAVTAAVATTNSPRRPPPGPAPTQRPPGQPAQPLTQALAQLVPDTSCLSRPLCWSERAAELRHWPRGEGGSQGPVAACLAGAGGGGGSWATPSCHLMGDPKKVRLCALSATGLWRRQEIQASVELA